MVIFKRLEIDMDRIREKMRRIFNKREQKALTKLYDLFEIGDWKACADLINDGKTFPRSRRGYSEKEHIEPEVWDILMECARHDMYEEKDFLRQTKDFLSQHNVAACTKEHCPICEDYIND